MKMDDQILAVLEKRVAEMEKTVFGDKPTPDNKESTTVVEALLNSYTMITSALSCRDNIVKVLRRLPELNDFLDPAYSNNDLEIEAKRQYILLVHPEMKELGGLLKEFLRVEKFAGSETIANVTKLSEKLDTVVANNVNTHLESSAASKQVLETCNKYNDILSSLEVILLQFDHAAAQIEEERKPKMPSTDD